MIVCYLCLNDLGVILFFLRACVCLLCIIDLCVFLVLDLNRFVSFEYDKIGTSGIMVFSFTYTLILQFEL